MSAKHTETPWHWINGDDDTPWAGQTYASLRTVEEFGEDKTDVIDGKHYTSFKLPKFILEAENVSQEDAAFIVRACNAHDDLVEALIMVRDADEDCIREGLMSMPKSARAKINAALSKAGAA